VHHVGILYDQFMMHGQRNIKTDVSSVSRIAYGSGLSFAVIQAGQMNGKEPQTSASNYGWYSQHDWMAGASRRWCSEVFFWAPVTEITNFLKKIANIY